MNVPETHRTDIVEGLLTGIPGKTRIAPNAVPADTLKINLGVPPARARIGSASSVVTWPASRTADA